jgi:hypothetical protein
VDLRLGTTGLNDIVKNFLYYFEIFFSFFFLTDKVERVTSKAKKMLLKSYLGRSALQLKQST